MLFRRNVEEMADSLNHLCTMEIITESLCLDEFSQLILIRDRLKPRTREGAQSEPTPLPALPANPCFSVDLKHDGTHARYPRRYFIQDF